MPLFSNLFFGVGRLRKDWIGAGSVLVWGWGFGTENGVRGLDKRICWCFSLLNRRLKAVCGILSFELLGKET